MRTRPDEVVIAAGRVGGILANASAPAAFIYENVMIETNLIHASWKSGVKRLLNFGSSCMYPKHAPQPMRPEHLMTGPMEPTSEPYATAKWVGLCLCQSYNHQYGTRYITAIPATAYGPGDNFDPKDGHVISALIRKFHEANIRGDRVVTLWGSGAVRREFLYVDDVAAACEQLLQVYEDSTPINVGSGQSHTIRDLAETVARVVGFEGTIQWDRSRPDGAPEKLLDSSAMHRLGWTSQITLQEGLTRTYRWFLEQYDRSFVKEQACASS